MDDLLSSLYDDITIGTKSLNNLYRKAKEINNKVTLKIVKEFLEKQEANQLTRTVKKKNINYDTIESTGLRDNFQMDLMNVPNSGVNKYEFFLTCIDVYSRYAFVEPIKTKNKENVFKAIIKIFKRSGIPKNLNCDFGKEFNNSLFKQYAEENNIKLWFSNPEQDNKNAIIERFHRTLRNIILFYELKKGKKYINDLQSIVTGYNNSVHRTIKTTPLKIWEEKAKNNQEIKVVVYDWKVGDNVRHAVDLSTFDKRSSNVKYSKDIYRISKIDGRKYYLETLDGKSELTKPFRGYQLTKAVGEKKTNTYDEENMKNNKLNKILRRLNKEGILEKLSKNEKQKLIKKYMTHKESA
jgi:hypothetical protein